jgi:tetratricopeptide (TPR) repeat protein
MSRAILAYSLAERGAFAEGLTHGEEASRIAEGVNHALSRLWPLRWVGDLYLLKGDLYRAMPELERGLALSQVAYLPIWIAHFAWRLGYAYALSGRIVEAEPLLEQAVQQYTSASMVVEQSRSVIHLGEAYVLAHRMEDAQNWAECALDLAQTHKQRGIQAWALRLLGDIARHRHPPEIESAEASYRQALALANELGMRPLQAHCHRGLGTVYSQTGQSEQARTELSTAIEMYRDMEMTFWVPETETALAAVEGKV